MPVSAHGSESSQSISTATWPHRARCVLPAAAHAPEPGTYSSVRVRGESSPAFPPATITFPFGSRVAVCPLRGASRLAVLVHVPKTGSNTSTVLSGTAPPPPTTMILPSVSSVAVCPPLEWSIGTPGVQAPTDPSSPRKRGSNVSVESWVALPSLPPMTRMRPLGMRVAV